MSQIYFGIEFYMFRTGFLSIIRSLVLYTAIGMCHIGYADCLLAGSVHHQESSTVYTTIGICHTGYADCLLAGSGCSIMIPLASNQQNLYDIYLLLCIQY